MSSGSFARFPSGHLLVCLFVFAAAKAMAQAPGKKGFDTYRMIQSRNIFDPSRQPIRTGSTGPRPQAPPVSRSDYASLTGTMVTPEKSLAFFSGSRSDYNKVLGVRGTIGGATITRISPSEVELERDGKKTVVGIGRPLPLGGSTSSPPAAAPSLSGSGSESTQSAPPPPISPTGSPASPTTDRDELIKRMMQRRQQETTK